MFQRFIALSGPDGSVDNVESVKLKPKDLEDSEKEADKLLIDEVIRVIKSSPKWETYNR